MRIYSLLHPLLSLLAAVATIFPLNVTAQTLPPVTSQPLLGGSAIDLSNSPVALILTNDYMCSGVLIGQREVLTAGHCSLSSAEEYFVVVGQKKYKVAGVFTHVGYKDNAPVTLYTVRFDLGMLVLTEDVTDITPVSLLADLPIKSGAKLTVIGRGSNEFASKTQSIGEGRIGEVTVDDSNGFVVVSSRSTTKVSTCAGDSGGPVFRIIDGVLTLAGIVSAGTNSVSSSGVCSTRDSRSGVSLFVNLQSSVSSDFLKQFGGLQTVSGSELLFQEGLKTLLPQVSSIRSATKAAQLELKLRKLLQFKGAGTERVTLLTALIRNIRAASRATSRTGLTAAVSLASGNARALLEL